MWTCLCGATRGLTLPWNDDDCARLAKFLYGLFPRLTQFPCQLIAEMCRQTKNFDLHFESLSGKSCQVAARKKHNIIYSTLDRSCNGATTTVQLPWNVCSVCMFLRVMKTYDFVDKGPFRGLSLDRGAFKHFILTDSDCLKRLNGGENSFIIIDFATKIVKYCTKRNGARHTSWERVPFLACPGCDRNPWLLTVHFYDRGGCSLEILHCHFTDAFAVCC